MAEIKSAITNDADTIDYYIQLMKCECEYQHIRNKNLDGHVNVFAVTLLALYVSIFKYVDILKLRSELVTAFAGQMTFIEFIKFTLGIEIYICIVIVTIFTCKAFTAAGSELILGKLTVDSLNADKQKILENIFYIYQKEISVLKENNERKSNLINKIIIGDAVLVGLIIVYSML